jgi:hypothetical protein
MPPDSCFDYIMVKDRLAGSVWKKDVCTECTCIQGKVSCFRETCQSIDTCPSGGEPITAIGHCCKVCPMQQVVVVTVFINLCEHRATIVARASLKSFKKGKKRACRTFSFEHIIKNFDLVPKK